MAPLTQTDVEAALLRFIPEHFLAGEDEPIDRATPLLAWGILDSLKVLTLIDFLEEEYELELPPESFGADALVNVEAIAALVVRVRDAS